MLTNRVRNWLQIDNSLSFALVARIWQAFSGPITIALQIRGLTTLQELGTYVVILSVVAVQPLFELGLASVLISQAGSLAAKASNERGPSEARADLNWLARASLRWFASIAVLYAIGAILIGYKVLSGSETTALDWHLPLVLAVVLSAISFAVSPRIYILEGAGEREYVYRIRFYQAIAGSFVAWLALFFGFKLWAIVAIFSVGAVFSVSMAYSRRADKLLRGEADAPPFQKQASWIAKIGPLQWRVAAISAAHYLASQLMLICVSNYHGETIAAPLGMTLQITTAIQSLALAWAQTKFPLISQQHARQEREAAGNLWRQTAVVSSGLLCLAVAALAALLAILPWFGRGWEACFVPPTWLLLLGVGLLANHNLALQSYYVLSRGAKPFVVVTLIGLLSTALAVWLGGKEYAVLGIITAYSFGLGAIALPLHTWAYLQFRANS